MAISKATREALSRYEFIPRRKIGVIYNGIRGLDRDEAAASATRQALRIPDAAFIMGTVARLDPVKNQGMMLEAFSNVLQQNPNVWLLIVGDGPERERLESQADDLNISHRVIFTGFQKKPENYLNVMDLFLLSSHTEGTSMTLLEAMSMGVPIVATAVGGTPELVRDRQNGRLSNAGDRKAFGAVLSEIAGESRQSLKLMADNGQRNFEKCFSIRKMVSEYGKVYSRLKGNEDGRKKSFG
ncbi:hypothetical protein GCM10007071_29360 [Marinobacter zhanjiangensis]|uniref:Glycosyl transferase family 1 domain-containing protein n=1 Tax=Marinobacter zhanjiangensis TaxID=578215 RepID=A0ABQ3B9V3_9GAMM|nr:hypothetical protein GCM10007071_29360 [Marinobacter zhanjiangensis]